jgi:hypothetical protein
MLWRRQVYYKQWLQASEPQPLQGEL